MEHLYRRSHSAGSIFAWARIRFTKVQSRSPAPCGFGIGSTRSPDRIAMWRCPASGPLHPSARMRRMNSRRLIGFGIRRLRIDIDAADHRKKVAMPRLYQNPVLEPALQLFTGLLQRVTVRPHSFTQRNRPEIATVLHHLITRLAQGG